MRRAMFLALLPAAFVTGCASQPPARGWSPQPEPGAKRIEAGDRFVDFTFEDMSGVRRSLSDMLGDYTVLAFTRCKTETHPVATDLLKAILDASRFGNDNVDLLGVNIHSCDSTGNGCSHCHVADAKPSLGSVCESSGAITHVYGDPEEDWLFAIGPHERIVLSAPATHGAEFAMGLKHEVNALSDRRVADAFIISDD